MDRGVQPHRARLTHWRPIRHHADGRHESGRTNHITAGSPGDIPPARACDVALEVSRGRQEAWAKVQVLGPAFVLCDKVQECWGTFPVSKQCSG